MKIIKAVAKVILTLIGVGMAMIVLAGCKSIKFEKIERTPIMDGTNLVCVCENELRGSYYTYGLKSDLEGLEFEYSPTNGVTLAINKAGSDVSEKHEKIIEASGSAVGEVAGVAVGAALGTSAAGTTAGAVKDVLDGK